MKKLISAVLLTIGLAGLLLQSGCVTDPDESTIPWSQPKDWEGGVPGLGNN